MSRVLVVGGGASGMLAAVFAAYNGNEVHIFEKNGKLGKKLFLTGKGRCNLTNDCDTDAFFLSVMSNPKFLYSSYHGFTARDTVDFFERIGVETKVERGRRVFPVTDRSSDVISGLAGELVRAGVIIHLNSKVIKTVCSGRFEYIELADGERVPGDACIVATGGMSYKATGSDGDGYRFARETGHGVTELFPSLVPFNIAEPFAGELQGLSLKNVSVTVAGGNVKVFEDFGEMIFTHFGVSGPLILSASAYTAGKGFGGRRLKLTVDLKPALSEERLDARIIRDFESASNRILGNSLGKLLPAKIIPVIIGLSGTDPEKRVNVITREERRRLARTIKNLTMTVTGTRGFGEAVVTRGGVNVGDVNPATMESKKVSGMYFVGEVLDLDALTGGFNLQIAWSTAHAAGSGIR